MGDEDLALVATGIGIGAAREAVRHALQMLPPPRLVISTGVAGGLRPELNAGDLIIAERLLLEAEDGSASAIPVEPAAPSLAAARDCVLSAQDALHRAGLPVAVGPLLTARRVLASAAAKREASQRTGAIAVDMESAVIAQEVAAAGYPFVCVRAVIDEAHHEIPGADLTDQTGRVAPLAAASYFIRNPMALAQVPALLKKLRRATISIAAALEALCAGL